MCSVEAWSSWVSALQIRLASTQELRIPSYTHGLGSMVQQSRDNLGGPGVGESFLFSTVSRVGIIRYAFSWDTSVFDKWAKHIISSRKRQYSRSKFHSEKQLLIPRLSKTDPEVLSTLKFSNPIFASDDSLTIHYATDPLLGFHLATDFPELDRKSLLNPKQSQMPETTIVEAARTQLRAWSTSFREWLRIPFYVSF